MPIISAPPAGGSEAAPPFAGSPPAPPAAPAAPAAAPAPAGAAAAEPPLVGEGSIIGRLVGIITPFFALFAGWLSGVVAHNIPGVTLDKGEIVAFMVAVSTSVLTGAWKWLQGLQAHEQRVAAGEATPLRLPSPPKP